MDGLDVLSSMLGWDPVGITRRAERTEKLTPEVLHGVFDKQHFLMDRYTLVTLKSMMDGPQRHRDTEIDTAKSLWPETSNF